jgi:hypothetical protein
MLMKVTMRMMAFFNECVAELKELMDSSEGYSNANRDNSQST